MHKSSVNLRVEIFLELNSENRTNSSEYFIYFVFTRAAALINLCINQ
jgi:hypothetical protein